MYQNKSLRSNGEDRVRSLRKILTRLPGTKFCINCTSSPHFAPSSCSYETIPNAPKYYKSYWNIALGSNGVDRVRPLRKIPMWLRGTNFCINCINSAHFEPSFIRKQNGPKCTQRVWNALKHEFRVQWGGSGAFVAKNSNTTSWHEHLH